MKHETLLKIFAPKKSTMPILAYAAVLPTGKTIASDLETSIVISTPGADVGIFTVDPFIKTPISESEYPAVNLEPHKTDFREQLIKREYLARAITHASTDHARYTMNGVLLDEHFGLVGVDGHRLFCERAASETSTPSAIIPIAGAKKLLKAMTNLKLKECLVAILPDRTARTFLTEDIQIIFRLVDGEFPDFMGVFAKSARTVLRFTPTKEALAAMAGWIKLEKALQHEARFHWADGTATIQWVPGPGALVKSAPPLWVADDAERFDDFAIDAKYLLDALAAGVSVSMEYSGPSGPVVFRRDDDSFSLIMPMRMGK
jgi:DNA polymerase III sliding clamp (beta) subunit (PCNA family)